MNPKWPRSRGGIKNTEAGRVGWGEGGAGLHRRIIKSFPWLTSSGKASRPDSSTNGFISTEVTNSFRRSARTSPPEKKKKLFFSLSYQWSLPVLVFFKMSLVTFWIGDNPEGLNLFCRRSIDTRRSAYSRATVALRHNAKRDNAIQFQRVSCSNSLATCQKPVATNRSALG